MEMWESRKRESLSGSDSIRERERERKEERRRKGREWIEKYGGKTLMIKIESEIPFMLP